MGRNLIRKKLRKTEQNKAKNDSYRLPVSFL